MEEFHKYMSKWKRKTIADFYENMFDLNRFFNEKINFLNSIIYKRILNKKITIIFSFKDLKSLKKYEFLNNKYVKNLYTDNNRGIIKNFISMRLIKREDAFCKFRHPSQKMHEVFSKYIKEILNDNI